MTFLDASVYSEESIITGGYLKPLSNNDNSDDIIAQNENDANSASLEEDQLSRFQSDIDNINGTAEAIQAAVTSGTPKSAYEHFNSIVYLTIARTESQYNIANEVKSSFENYYEEFGDKQLNQGISLLKSRAKGLEKASVLAEESFISNMKYKISRTLSNMEGVEVMFNRNMSSFKERGSTGKSIEHPAYSGYLGVNKSHPSSSEIVNDIQHRLSQFDFENIKKMFKETIKVIDGFKSHLDLNDIGWTSTNVANAKDAVNELNAIYNKIEKNMAVKPNNPEAVLEPLEASDINKIEHIFKSALDQRKVDEAISEFNVTMQKLNASWATGYWTKALGWMAPDMRQAFRAIIRGSQISKIIHNSLKMHQNTLHAVAQYIKDSTR